jgi:hypothetical protein
VELRSLSNHVVDPTVKLWNLDPYQNHVVDPHGEAVEFRSLSNHVVDPPQWSCGI